MRKAIYKIENKINHKIYIGQSNNPKRRFIEHCNNATKHKSLIHDAIVKYGKNNFTIEILEWTEEPDKKEKEYISKYRSLTPYGYNICPGGNNPPHGFGEKNNYARISNETASRIIEDLKDWSIPRRQIIKKYKVTNNIVRHINEGTAWKKEGETYPLRPEEKTLNNDKVQKIIELLILTDIPQNKIGPMFGWGRSAVKEINAGRNHFNPNLIYPIRNNKEKNKAILNL